MDEKAVQETVNRLKKENLNVRLTHANLTHDATISVPAVPGYTEIDFDNIFNKTPDFIRIVVDQNCALGYKVRRGKEAYYRNYPEGLQANAPLRITGEGWRAMKVTPSAFPCIIKLYASVVNPEEGETMR